MELYKYEKDLLLKMINQEAEKYKKIISRNSEWESGFMKEHCKRLSKKLEKLEKLKTKLSE